MEDHLSGVPPSIAWGQQEVGSGGETEETPIVIESGSDGEEEEESGAGEAGGEREEERQLSEVHAFSNRFRNFCACLLTAE